MDQLISILSLLVGIVIFFIQILLENSVSTHANIVDPDPNQKPHSASSELGLYCLPMSHKKEARLTNVYGLTLCIREPPKEVLLQTVKTQMKCSIMLHFIRVYTACRGKIELQTRKQYWLKFID